MAERVVKTMRFSEEQLLLFEFFKERYDIDFSNAMRLMLKRFELGDGMEKDERVALHKWKYHRRKELEEQVVAADVTPAEPTVCGGCGQGDPWFTWYPYEREGLCQGCGAVTKADVAA